VIKKLRICLTASFGVVAVLAFASNVQAQATRTWVSGVGDDVNPCSRTAPCKTFAGAISKTAPGGIIDALDPAGYGAVTITKSITIEGGLWNSSILNSGNVTAIHVAAGNNDTIIIRNLAIEGAGTGFDGIRVTSAGSVHVEHVTITGQTQKGIEFVPTSPAQLFVDDVTLRNNTVGGVFVQNGQAAINHTQAADNGYGVRVGVGAIVTVSNSTASGGGMGFLAANDPAAVLNIDHSVTTHNDYGIVASQSATVRCNAVTIINNHFNGLFNDGISTIVSFGNNTLLANGMNGSFTSTVGVQ
jgi:Right handed beta helix region